MYILYSNTVKGETNNKPNHILLTWTKPKTKYNPRVLNHLQHKWKYSLSFRYSYIVPYYISRLDLFSAFHLSCPYIFNLRITIHALGIYVYWIGSKFKYKKLKLCSNVKNMGSFQSYFDIYVQWTITQKPHLFLYILTSYIALVVKRKTICNF